MVGGGLSSPIGTMGEQGPESILLTIAIPTWNRAEHVEAQLKRTQTIAPGPWEVVVSDNGSTDDTLLRLTQQESEFESLDLGKRFRYVRHSQNRGFDWNVLFLYGNARGKFVWMLSDDDWFDPQSLSPQFFDALNEDLGCVIFNQDHDGGPAIKDGDLVDLVPYNPRSVKFTRAVGARTPIDKASAEERVSLVLLGSQLSTAAFRTGLKVPLDVKTGGLPQSLLLNLSLLRYPAYLITDVPVVKCGQKTSISSWFLDSCLFGAHQLYSSPEMKVGSHLAQEVSLATAEVGLTCLALGAAGQARVDAYWGPLPLVVRLARTYRMASVRLSPRWLAYAIFTVWPALFGLFRRVRDRKVGGGPSGSGGSTSHRTSTI